MTKDIIIRNVEDSDIERVLEIYSHYVLNTWVTFQENIPKIEEFIEKAKTIRDTYGYPYYVLVENDYVIGYSYVSSFRPFDAYRTTVELTIYLDKDYMGKGYGCLLYKKVLGDLAKLGIHNAIAVLGYPGEQSKKFHEKLGFREVGVLHEAGYKFDRWLDVGFLELIIK